MESIKQLYKIGLGPSSSHTMGPRKAATRFLESLQEAPARFEAALYGSLAATGKGHLTDVAILDVLSPVAPTEILWAPDTILPFHTNGMTFRAFAADGSLVASRTYYSIGGGDIVEDGETRTPGESIYPLTRIKDIQQWCEETGRSYWEYVDMYEQPDIWDYLAEVWRVMKAAVERGIEAEGVLPGGLGVRRKSTARPSATTCMPPAMPTASKAAGSSMPTLLR